MTAPAYTERRTSATASASPSSGPAAGLSKFVPLRQGPDDTTDDGKRIELAHGGWARDNDLWRPQLRTIEEIVRMICGQQRAIFHPGLNRWMDVNEWMPAEEREYRSRPIFNRLLPWYVITHARATENTPIVTFVPGPDRRDAELAETLDTAIKTVWFESNMEDVHDRLMGWVVAAGRGHTYTRIDPTKGAMRPWVGEGMVPVTDANDQPMPDGEGGQLHAHLTSGVPFNPQGQPAAHYRMSAPGSGELVPHGAPHQTPIGQLVIDVLSPFQVRPEWGGLEPWHRKRRHRVKRYLTVEDVYEAFGVEVDPDTRGGAADIGELERIAYGSGFFGAAGGETTRQRAQVSTEGYVEVTELWEAPCSYPGMRVEDDPNGAGGRWLVTTPKKVLRDGPRPVKFPYTSPIHTFEFVRIPGRPAGTSAAEPLIPIQRAINEGRGRVDDHVRLRSNPIGVVDAASGLKASSFKSRPGLNYELHRRPGVPAIEFVRPPELGSEVFQSIQQMGAEFDLIGFTAGANDPGTPGDSGEKVKEVRFNTDRFLGPTMRRAAGEYGRMYETWMALFAVIWDMETTISYAGEDNVARTITVFPEMFQQGKVHVRPDVESMLPEGRGEKQEKVVWAYSNGLFGLPGTPAAMAKFWELAQMPHLSRMAKVGGIHGTTAEQENGQLVQGGQAQAIPVFEWYDDAVHLMIHEKFMSSPEFKKLDPNVQDQFVLHRQAHKFNVQKKQMQAISQAQSLQSQIAPPGGPGGPGGPPHPPGAPGGGNAPPPGPPGGDIRPSLPTPPSGPLPGGGMPTVTAAAPADLS